MEHPLVNKDHSNQSTSKFQSALNIQWSIMLVVEYWIIVETVVKLKYSVNMEDQAVNMGHLIVNKVDLMFIKSDPEVKLK